MEPIHIIGFLAASLIGVSLGLIGGGGSILTVPVMVYFFGISPMLSTAYSLFVVGSTSFFGAFKKTLSKQVCIKTSIIFSIPSLIAVYLTRRYFVPFLPDIINFPFGISLSKDLAVMLFFALIMLVASFSMIWEKKQVKPVKHPKAPIVKYSLIGLEGLLVGSLTGIVGAGGGFLIIPALVLLGRLPMKLAVGTSLVIISIKSLVGFMGDLKMQPHLDWAFLLQFSVVAIIGVYIGSYLTKYISGEKLKSGFGWFVLSISIFIFINELTQYLKL
ncbi:MAG: sulfite exporter TauE/SafE family protein [Bacteroidota bacterium]